MPIDIRFFRPAALALALASTLAGAAQTAPAPKPRAHSVSKPAAARPLAPLSDEEKATQILSRFSFGPRPGGDRRCDAHRLGGVV